MKKRNVYIKLPKRGLGNLLLIWARGAVFCKLNHLDYITSGWVAIRWGAWLRNENKKRMYLGYFQEEPLLIHWLVRMKFLFKRPVEEPPIEKLDNLKNNYFLFQQEIISEDLFEPLRPYRFWIKSELVKMLTPRLRAQFNQLKKPAIAIHIRRGDFKYANPITPIQHFITCINIIREICKEKMPVTIFSDATKEELVEILALEDVSFTTSKADILDILQMSESQILLLSESSTFSYWGAFLSSAFVIIPHTDWQVSIRNDRDFPEFKLDYTDNKSCEELTDLLMEKMVKKNIA